MFRVRSFTPKFVKDSLEAIQHKSFMFSYGSDSWRNDFCYYSLNMRTIHLIDDQRGKFSSFFILHGAHVTPLEKIERFFKDDEVYKTVSISQLMRSEKRIRKIPYVCVDEFVFLKHDVNEFYSGATFEAHVPNQDSAWLIVKDTQGEILGMIVGMNEKYARSGG